MAFGLNRPMRYLIGAERPIGVRNEITMVVSVQRIAQFQKHVLQLFYYRRIY